VRIFYDCEFLEDGQTIDLISIGMITESDDSFYAVNDALLTWRDTPDNINRKIVRQEGHFVLDHVVPHLPLKEHPSGKGPMYHRAERVVLSTYTLDEENPEILPLRLIRPAVRDFVLSFEEPELWAWYGAYDHVALAQLVGGRMIDLPEGFPMWTNDIRTLALLAGPQAREGAPAQRSQAHHALNDARHDMDLYDYYAPLVDVRRLA
jgi:3' exoribonuclease, RNase T-like